MENQEQPNTEEERLSEEEALAFQEYATSREGIAFSEKAKQETYAEAEQFIAKLREKDFAWLGVDWKKFDLRNIEHLTSLEERLDGAVRALVESKKDEPAFSKFRKFIDAHKGVLLPLAFSAALLLGELPKEAEAFQFLPSFTGQMDRRHGMTEVEHQNHRFEEFMLDWKAAHPSVASITVINLQYDENEGFRQYHPRGAVRAIATLEIRTVDGKTLYCEGKYFKTIRQLFPRPEAITPGLPGFAHPELAYPRSDAPVFSPSFVESQAIRAALGSCRLP